MSVYELIKLGRRYLHLWPEKSELASYFSEYRAIQLSRLVYRSMPGVALFVFVMQLYFMQAQTLSQMIVYPLFMISLPIQTLLILGVKADKFLPPSLASWYREGVAKINQQGGNIKLSMQKPRYIDLAELLALTYSKA